MPRFARYALLLPLPSAASAPIVIGGIVVSRSVRNSSCRHALDERRQIDDLDFRMVHPSPVDHFEPLKFFWRARLSQNQPAVGQIQPKSRTSRSGGKQQRNPSSSRRNPTSLLAHFPKFCILCPHLRPKEAHLFVSIFSAHLV